MTSPCSVGFFQCFKFQNYWDGFEKYSLPSMAADSETITISGFSSGARMASAMHVTYSDTFKGAGVLAGSSYIGLSIIMNLLNHQIIDKNLLEKYGLTTMTKPI